MKKKYYIGKSYTEKRRINKLLFTIDSIEKAEERRKKIEK